MSYTEGDKIRKSEGSIIYIDELHLSSKSANIIEYDFTGDKVETNENVYSFEKISNILKEGEKLT